MKNVVIEPWMIKLKLKANELLIFAAIVANSRRDEYGEITSSQLRALTGCCSMTVFSTIKRLEEKNLVRRKPTPLRSTEKMQIMAYRPKK